MLYDNIERIIEIIQPLNSENIVFNYSFFESYFNGEDKKEIKKHYNITTYKKAYFIGNNEDSMNNFLNFMKNKLKDYYVNDYLEKGFNTYVFNPTNNKLANYRLHKFYHREKLLTFETDYYHKSVKLTKEQSDKLIIDIFNKILLPYTKEYLESHPNEKIYMIINF